MPSFSDWYDEAIQWGDGWKKVAGNASRAARYREPTAMGDFQAAVADEFPRAPDVYNAVCLDHCLSGQEIPAASLPGFLSRVVGERVLKRSFRSVIGFATRTPALRNPTPDDRWTRIDELLASEDDADVLLFVPARVLDEENPSRRAVFATFDPADAAVDNQPRSRFHERLGTDRSADETSADCAARRLALEDRPESGQPTEVKVLLAYSRDEVGPKRFPVPPDAGWHPRFRAITPSDTMTYGRTFPDGSSETDHAAGRCGENEVVHPNDGIPLSEVFVRSLGKTSCATS